MSDPLNLQTLSISGPFWTAELTVAEIEVPERQRALRTIFVDRTPRTVGGVAQVLSPGTLLVLGIPRWVELRLSRSPTKTLRWERPSAAALPRLDTPAAVRSALDAGQACLLLLAANPEQWPTKARGVLPPFTCLAGEIALEVNTLTAKPTVREALYKGLALKELASAALKGRAGSAGVISSIAVHASGVSLAGAATLPWSTEKNTVPGIFQLARVFDSPEDDRLRFRLTFELERLTEGETTALVEAWYALSALVNPPHPLNQRSEDVRSAPRWVTFEIVAPDQPPRLYWEIDAWQAAPGQLPLFFARGEINVLLSDRQPYDQESPPSTLARLIPDRVAIGRRAIAPAPGQPIDLARMGLVITVGAPRESGPNTLAYSALSPAGNASAGSLWSEQISLTETELSYEPVNIAQILREGQALITPVWDRDGLKPLTPALLWGAVPIADGWLQMPIPNLSAQNYADAELVGPLEGPPQALLQGAVMFANTDAAPAQYPHEQPWSLTLIDAHEIFAEWVFPEGTAGFRAGWVRLVASEPVLVIDGLLWLSRSAPSAADALPDFDNWVSGLHSVPMRTVRTVRSLDSDKVRLTRDPFPAAFTFALLQLALRPTANPDVEPGAAHLGAWELRCQANTARIRAKGPTIFDAIFNGHLLDAHALREQLVLAWRRHPTLPMIQALALTQSNFPPDMPSASRQLMPFALPLDADGRAPDGWVIGSSTENGAATWPQLLGATRSTGDWWKAGAHALADLPMAALSIPGMYVDPGQTDGLIVVASGWPQGGYRFDLPYADEVYALAALPKKPRDPREVSPLPDDPPPEPPAPLGPASYRDHWRRLSELASLARGDATDALARTGQATLIRGLVEPYDWPIRIAVDTVAYPGSLAFADSAMVADPKPVLPHEQLRGFQGAFTLDETTRTLRTARDSDSQRFAITAGSMSALRTAEGAVRDQRGLHRSATTVHGALLSTPITLELHADAIPTPMSLISTLQPWELEISDGQIWRFWFRDLPLRLDNANPAALDGDFIWDNLGSPARQDVNDPEAHARAYNYLSGYEWRLGELVSRADRSYLELCGLHLYPLRLDQVKLKDGKPTTVVLHGRLQLPLPDAVELADLNNAVALTFVATETGRLTLKAVDLVGEAKDKAPEGEWPLALKQSELSDAPRIVWKKIVLTDAGITLDTPSLTFSLFDTPWSVELETLFFPRAGVLIEPVKAAHTQNPPTVGSFIVPTHVALTLALQPSANVALSLAHSVTVELSMRLARTNTAASFDATVSIPILGSKDAAIHWDSGILFSDLQIPQTDESGASEMQQFGRSFQFTWSMCEAAAITELQVLPGMHLAEGPLPGCAAIIVAVGEAINGIPQLQIERGFVEAQLAARWGQPLHDGVAGLVLTETALAQSSSGDLSIGYTGHWQGQGQEGFEQLLLNGFIELTSLISWPTALDYNAENAYVHLPAIRDATSSLGHTRHTMRLLLNQTLADSATIATGDGARLFQLRPGKIWQLLAVVEHQFLDLMPQQGGYQRGVTKSWTLVQEVRLLRPSTMRATLEGIGQARTIDPTAGIAAISTHGDSYAQSDARALLVTALDRLGSEDPDTLIVEASAAHWVGHAPRNEARPTVIQYLPGGSQHAVLSSPGDYGPTDPRHPGWLLLDVAFLGRLQQRDRDLAAVDTAVRQKASPLALDPVLALAAQTAVPDGAIDLLILMLTNRGDRTPIRHFFVPIDTDVGRSWARLDPTTLEENWLRLQTPPPEEVPELLPSISAALLDTPARLSRTASLTALYDVFRPAYPPTTVELGLPAPIQNDTIVWRPESILLPQRVSKTRNTTGLIALYSFSEGEGNLVRDRSGLMPAIDLRIEKGGTVQWLPGGGVEITSPALIRSTAPASRLITACKSSNEITIEVWVRPAQLVLPEPEHPGRIVTLSKTFELRNATLQQGDFKRTESSYYHARLRTSKTNDEGDPPLPSAEGTLKTVLTHVVFTRDSAGNGRLYIDGVERSTQKVGGTFANWETGAVFLCLANELERNRAWLGSLHFVALYSRALSVNDVRIHYALGWAERRAPWAHTGMLLSALDTSTESATRHAAATLLPARLRLLDRRPGRTGKPRPNSSPLSFVVSPYIDLEFRRAPIDAGTTGALTLLAAELVTIDPQTNALRGVATRIWEASEGTPVDAQLQVWARDTHALRAPESPIALLRLREIRTILNPAVGQAIVVIVYRFALVADMTRQATITRRATRLRAELRSLRFRDGHYAGKVIPEAVRPFEMAPPQVVGVQAIYQEPQTQPGQSRPWPWGLSALRLSLRYTPRSEGILGAPILPLHEVTPNEPQQRAESGPRLWWQTVARRTQFRVGGGDNRPAAGLPYLFRAASVSSLLPAPPNSALPALRRLRGMPTGKESDISLVGWQPVLPGAVRYVLHGARSGLMAAMRHHLLSQPLDGDGPAVLSGAVPIQHRAPRPVPLPPNPEQDTQSANRPEQIALLPWASPFAPTQQLHASRNPLDEAFFIGTRAANAETSVVPARGLRLRLTSPARGLLLPAWSRKRSTLDSNTDLAVRPEQQGELGFSIEALSDGAPWNWQLDIAIVDGTTRILYEYERPPEPPQAADAGKPRTIVARLKGAGDLNRALDPLHKLLANKASGSVITVQVQVRDTDADDGLIQILSIPLRIGGGSKLPLPLEPAFVHFEDPEYNRRLVSQTARAAQLVATSEGGRSSTRSIALASDRREYNVDSLLALRHDWEDNRRSHKVVETTLKAVSQAIATQLLTLESPPVGLSEGDLMLVESSGAMLAVEVLGINDGDITVAKAPQLTAGSPVSYGGAALPQTAVQGSTRYSELQLLTLKPQLRGLHEGDVLLVQPPQGLALLAEVERLSGNEPIVRAQRAIPVAATIMLGAAYIELRRIEPSGIVSPMAAYAVRAGQLLNIDLADVQLRSGVTLTPGDLIEARLLVRETAKVENEERIYKPIIVQVNVIASPVIPAPEAAYGLLRSQTCAEVSSVECVRFAWSPRASRIELVSAADLRGELVRRRAVFQWRDAARPQGAVCYALQKIARNGSTAIPALETFLSLEEAHEEPGNKR